MPRWLLFIVTLLGMTAFPALLVFLASGGDWRQAWSALKAFAALLWIPLALAAVMAGWLMLFPPHP